VKSRALILRRGRGNRLEVQKQIAATVERRAYPTDLTDAQWALLDPWLSARAWTGRPRTVDLREVVNAVFYLLRTGCQWRHLPHDCPHWCTVRYYPLGGGDAAFPPHQHD
jgi:transposase